MNLSIVLRKILHYFNLEPDKDDFEKIHKEIVSGIVFKGTNLWILVFAIIIASIGLNMNSTAVIIGAMLISPLMGPINGIGYSIATYDFSLLRQSLKNFGFAVGTSLAASTVYFALSPVSTAHSELLARTSPTIYDVLIALFGGLSGIVAISSKFKGNVIPGVAIATALMPPLCTAGYGLAMANFNFFFGAMYLFTINSVFIAIASIIISQILKFPITSFVGSNQKQKVNRWITTVIIIIILPSIYFWYVLVQKEKFTENANRYISNISMFEGNYLLRNEIDPKNKTIILIYGGQKLEQKHIDQIKLKALDFNLNEAKILIQQGLTLEKIDNTNFEELKLREELTKLSFSIKEKDQTIDSMLQNGYLGETILREIKVLFPQISGCIYADSYSFHDSMNSPVKTSIIWFSLNESKPKISLDDQEKIINWIKERIQSNNVNVIFRK